MIRVLGSPVAAAAAIIGLGACGDSSGTQPTDQNEPTPSASVSVVDNAFDPRTASVEPGEVVQWTFEGSNSHNVTFDDPGIDDSQTTASGSFAVRFPQEGQFSYYCTVHGRSVMSGLIAVQGEPTSGDDLPGYP